MPDRIPEMRRANERDIVQLVVGQELDVGVYKNNDRGQPIAVGLHELIRPVVKEVLSRAGISPDGTLEDLGETIAEAAIGRLVSSEGFRVTYGDHFRPTHITEVTLRPSEPVITQASVEHTPPQIGS